MAMVRRFWGAVNAADARALPGPQECAELVKRLRSRKNDLKSFRADGGRLLDKAILG